MSDDTAQGKPRAKGGGLALVALRNAASALISRVSALIVGILLTPIVLRGLGQEMYGVVQVATSVYEYMSLLRGGLSAALRRFVTLFHHGGRAEDARRYYAVGFWWSGVARTAILLLGVAIARPLCHFLHIPDAAIDESTLGIILIIVATVVADAASLFEIPVYATGRTEWQSSIRTGAAWLRLVLTAAAFHYFEPSLPLYAITLIVVEAIPLLVFAIMAQRSRVVGAVVPRPEFGDPGTRRELFQYGGLAMIAHVAALLYTTADTLLIGRIYGAVAVTHYTLGTRWSPMIRGFLLTTIGSLQPLFTQLEAQGESGRSRQALLDIVRFSTAVAVPACLVPCVVGDLFLVHWVGEEYRASFQYMVAMLAPLTLEIALAPVWIALQARGRIGWIATADIVVSVGNVVISLVLALGFKLGLLGFALGNTAALLAKNLLLRPFMSARDASFPTAREYLQPFPLALLGGAPGLVLLYLARPLYRDALWGVLLAGGIGAVICLAGALLLAVGPRGMRSMLDRVRQRKAKR
ncbi:MAG: oligosaccharide flippase family protein [Candidatus Eisenbacteria bacterium]|nr:oligosaccharide flippase family protein [Candidatus Eisenbacteria bacterium]